MGIEMKAGRELDALVAEKVMGWVRKEPAPCSDPCVDEGGQGYARCETCGWTGNWADASKDHLDERGSEPAPYSTDIAAAWEVVEKMYLDPEFLEDRAYEIMLKRSHPDFVICSLWRLKDLGTADMVHFEAQGKSAAHAICLAALKAVGVEG